MTNQEPDELKTSTSVRGNPANPRFRTSSARRSTDKNLPKNISQGKRKLNSAKQKKSSSSFSQQFGSWLRQVLGGVGRQKQRKSKVSKKAAPLNSSINSSINSSNSSNSSINPSTNFLDAPLPHRRPSSPLPTPASTTPPRNAPRNTSRARLPKRPPNQKKGSSSTVVYGLRLLILGVGLGAIAGTILYISDPAARPISNTTKMSLTEAAPKTPSPSSSLASPIAGMKLQQGIPALQAQLDELIRARPNFQVGVFLQDLDNGSFVNLLGENPFAAASTIKLPILIAFFQDVDAKKINLGEMLTLEKRFVATGSGELQDLPLGTKYTTLDVATRMMVGSDNTATNMIIDRLGGLEALNQRFQYWGLKNTSLQAVLPDLEGTNLTTPKELAMVMAAVEQGELVSRRSRDLVFSIMQRTENDTLLPKGLEKNAVIAHKTGNLGTLVADAGLIDMANGKRYILVVMVKRPRNDQQGAELVRQISRTTYNYFKQPSPSSKP